MILWSRDLDTDQTYLVPPEGRMGGTFRGLDNIWSIIFAATTDIII